MCIVRRDRVQGPCGSNDMQMPHSVSENSTVITANVVNKQTTGVQGCSGFPRVIVMLMLILRWREEEEAG